MHRGLAGRGGLNVRRNFDMDEEHQISHHLHMVYGTEYSEGSKHNSSGPANRSSNGSYYNDWLPYELHNDNYIVSKE